ncbi:polysaccharide deacetylase family protein [Amycolatopsis acidiphila]|uniref:Polysaccharide deacetylase family protein n=1 Tax=Amycolatopsis acidiphila TaxID=715473 RepID=A0A558AN05_9PSEU|nr:polysaccharide deacetylase family protein [Amycolatopsis acidiphila]TVT25637.1 polysaccharide deacetylase family protein [Amycolatopsis acidiphila]UIJ60392.1 polysaccharide deacetylase family protein [Amycolatopsis acidiphila]GHG90432.1 chitooligosaccharide deacetylase [Amycolatopsis acidiphila]
MKRAFAAALALVALTTACTRTEAAVPSYTPPSLHLNAPYPAGEVQQQAGPIVDGKVPQVRRIAVDRPLVFLTIDDGAVPDPDAPRLIRESGTHPVLFLNEIYVRGHEDYFKQVLAAGATLGDHTVNHPDLKGKSLAYQQEEICEDADDLQRALGVRPVLFRPPFGNWDDNTLKAAANCGMRASVLWTASVNDGRVDFQEGKRLQPGDIVLMHFRKTFTEDFAAFVDQSTRDGLTPVPLPDFLG